MDAKKKQKSLIVRTNDGSSIGDFPRDGIRGGAKKKIKIRSSPSPDAEHVIGRVCARSGRRFRACEPAIISRRTAWRRHNLRISGTRRLWVMGPGRPWHTPLLRPARSRALGHAEFALVVVVVVVVKRQNFNLRASWRRVHAAALCRGYNSRGPCRGTRPATVMIT